MLGVWLSRFGGRCLFDFGASNLVGSVFSNQWYCSFTISSIFEKVIMLGVWLSRFGGRCLFDFGASNPVGSVFSNQWYCSFTLVERCSGSCKLHVSQLCQRTLAKLSVKSSTECP
ncbi:hypothetical protein COP2_037346 [Malus domestica]